MRSPNLSKKAIDVLAENGYSFKSKDGITIMKYRPGIMGAIVLMFITLFLAIPVFSAGTIYGIILIAGVLGALFIYRIYFSKKSSLIINHNTNTFSAVVDTYHQEDQPLSMIAAIKLNSRFVDEYTTAAKNSVEEYLITISIQLISKEEITLFQLKAEQSEPTPEVNEIYNMLEDAVKGAKSS